MREVVTLLSVQVLIVMIMLAGGALAQMYGSRAGAICIAFGGMAALFGYSRWWAWKNDDSSH